MSIRTQTPTNKASFEFDIDTNNNRIVITTTNGNQHAYHLNCLFDLYQWLKNDQEGQWVLLGTRGEEEEPDPDTVEAWARSPQNPIGGFYGLTNGRRGRFASYIPSVLECLGFVEVTHNAKDNVVRAL
jgi:hypothetical protein